MSKISVSLPAALKVLEAAVKESQAENFRPSSRLKDAILSIIGGTHLTYKYLLATGLLAKATNVNANPLVLQAGANELGAYDARSLCHKVIVPHEDRLLDNGLGGSNEPFLNKPARFPMIELSNAVRAGNDRRALKTLHAALSSLRSQKEATRALCDLVYFARKQKASENLVLSESALLAIGGREEVLAFLTRLISSSVHGETSVLAAAIVFWIIGKSRGQDWSVQVHPVNESGRSSKEISDIDVRLGDDLIISAEVKDKDFKIHDVEYAVQKVVQANFRALHFICGPRGKLRDGHKAQPGKLANDRGVELYMLNLHSLIVDTIAFSPTDMSLQLIAELIQKFSTDARVKSETRRHIVDTFNQCRSLQTDDATL